MSGVSRPRMSCVPRENAKSVFCGILWKLFWVDILSNVKGIVRGEKGILLGKRLVLSMIN